MVYSKSRTAWTFRASPDVVEWLTAEAKLRGTSRNEVLNIMCREARDGVFTVHTDEGRSKKVAAKRWWQEDPSEGKEDE